MNIDQGRAAHWDVSRWIACEPSEGVFLHRSQATALHEFAARRLPVGFFGGRVTLVLGKVCKTPGQSDWHEVGSAAKMCSMEQFKLSLDPLPKKTRKEVFLDE
ncbi:MAG: hypothetical protein ACK5QH_18960, partial [Rubrivivax sp.]